MVSGFIRRPLIAGNWKMYKTAQEAKNFAAAFKEEFHAADTDVRVAVLAPFTQLALLQEELHPAGVLIGAQNVHYEKEGAFTGEIAYPMLQEIGISFCIVGHSERRAYFGETDETVNLKLRALFGHTSITPVLCVGERPAEREAGTQEYVVRDQLQKDLAGLSPQEIGAMVIAYEPIWAIGTGKTATASEAQDMCAFIRETVEELAGEEAADRVLLQYGGSVKPENATEILSQADIDGALVGGASLDPRKFLQIIRF